MFIPKSLYVAAHAHTSGYTLRFMNATSTYNLDSFSLQQLEARPGAKWNYYPKDVLACWVAEMDFPLADSVKRAIVDQVTTNDLGYQLPNGLPGLREAVAGRLASKYGYAAQADDVLLLGTTGSGLNLSVRAFSQPGDEVLLLTPLYPPFKNAVKTAGRTPVEVELVNGNHGYSIDFDALERAVTPTTSMLMLCSPHNPVGKVFTREELNGLADLAMRHNLTIVSDELHADLVLEGTHIPLASLSPEVAQRTVTLYGPTKAFNIPGLKVSFAISSNHELLDKMNASGEGLTVPPNILAQAATLGAYSGGEQWLNEVLEYIRGNRDYLLQQLAQRMPRVKMHKPTATYLAWFDLRAFDLGDEVAKALSDRAKVGLNDGASFGAGGQGFARFNFGTNRAVLDEALNRLETVLG